MKAALHKRGIEVVAFNDWPGFEQVDYSSRETFTDQIVSSINRDQDIDAHSSDSLRKAQPEAEALVIITNERDGRYCILNAQGEKSSAWFVSHTSMLNKIAKERVTWRPEAFLQFVLALPGSNPSRDAEDSFETLLWMFAQSGISVLDERVVDSVFGGVIDPDSIDIGEQKAVYAKTLEQKYGAPLDDILTQIAPKNRSLATIQLANEMLQSQVDLLKALEQKVYAQEKERRDLQLKLEKVKSFQKKMEAKESRQKKKGKRSPKRKRG